MVPTHTVKLRLENKELLPGIDFMYHFYCDSLPHKGDILIKDGFALEVVKIVWKTVEPAHTTVRAEQIIVRRA